MRALRNIGVLATCRPGGGQGEIHAVRNAALVWKDDEIVWAGPESELPTDYEPAERWDADGRLVVPGLVDCHTHLAFGGWRADEFRERIAGRSYLEIARAGGGILSTVRETRALSEEALEARARGFLARMLALGVTTVECKSGYGLDVENELKQLRAYAALSENGPIRIVSTLLAHVVPPEYRDERASYIRLFIDDLIPRVVDEGLASCCDVFVEESAFIREEAREILAAGAAAGLEPKLHADQLSDGGGASLAAELGALSADHLEHASAAGIEAMAVAGVVAVSLPIATLYLNQPPMPARRFIDAGVPVAVATDFNPGSAPSYHLPFAMTLACALQRMIPAEVLKGSTHYAARAIGLDSAVGSLEPGKAADFAVIDAADVDEWLYHFRANACRATVIGGNLVAGELPTPSG